MVTFWFTRKYVRLVKFALVGLIGVFVNIGLLWFLTEKLGLYYLLSAIASAEAAILSNFILNEKWTFRDRRSGGRPHFFLRLCKSNIFRLVGLGIYIGILFVLVEFFGTYYLLASAVGVILGMGWNYATSVRFVWRV